MTPPLSPDNSPDTATGWMDETLYDAFRVRLKASRILFEDRTEHQHLVIFDNPLFGRCLMLDGVTQLTETDEFIYHEMMAHMPLLAQEHPEKVLIIGGGDGGVAREVLRHPSVRNVTLCELDQGVIDLSLKYFPDVSAGAFNDSRLKTVIGDGCRFVAETRETFDAILVDSTDPIGPGAVLFTPEFYADCRKCLGDTGILVTQNGVPFMQPDELRHSMQALKTLFGDATAFLATTPTYAGGPMAYGWATSTASYRQSPPEIIQERFTRAQLSTNYFTPALFNAAFALPAYVQKLTQPEAAPKENEKPER